MAKNLDRPIGAVGSTVNLGPPQAQQRLGARIWGPRSRIMATPKGHPLPSPGMKRKKKRRGAADEGRYVCPTCGERIVIPLDRSGVEAGELVDVRLF